MPQAGRVTITAEASGYEEHNGVMFAARASLDVPGLITIDTHYMTTELNVEVDHSIFEKTLGFLARRPAGLRCFGLLWTGLRPEPHAGARGDPEAPHRAREARIVARRSLVAPCQPVLERQ